MPERPSPERDPRRASGPRRDPAPASPAHARRPRAVDRGGPAGRARLRRGGPGALADEGDDSYAGCAPGRPHRAARRPRRRPPSGPRPRSPTSRRPGTTLQVEHRGQQQAAVELARQRGRDPRHPGRAGAGHGSGHPRSPSSPDGRGRAPTSCSTGSRSCATRRGGHRVQRPGPGRGPDRGRAGRRRRDRGRRHLLEPPYVIDAIGDAETLAAALAFPGGFIERGRGRSAATVERRGARRPSRSPRAPTLADAVRECRRGRAIPADRARRSSLPSSRRPARIVDQPARSAVYPDDLKYTAEHEWVRDPGESEGSVRIGITDFAQERSATSSTSRCPRWARASRPAAPSVSWSRPSRSATSTPRSAARSSPATRRSTPRPSWSTPTRTARAGCSRSCPPTPAPWTALLDAAAYQAGLDGLMPGRPRGPRRAGTAPGR